MTTPNENGPVATKAASKLTHFQNSISTAIGNANPLRAIDVADLINAIGYTAPDAAEAQAPGAQLAVLEPCRCETEGRCASCDRLPLVLRQRLGVSDLQRQTTRTVNSSPTVWNTDQPMIDPAQI